MDPQKDFRASIVGRWIRKKISRPLSSDDGLAKRFPSLHRRTMNPKKDFQASIVGRWTRKKFSHLYRRTMDPKKVFHTSIVGRWTIWSLYRGNAIWQPLPSPPLKVGRRSKVEGRRSKVKGRRSKVKGQRSKVQGQRSKVKGLRSKVKGLRSKVKVINGAGFRFHVSGFKQPTSSPSPAPP